MFKSLINLVRLLLLALSSNFKAPIFEVPWSFLLLQTFPVKLLLKILTMCQ